MQFVPYGGEPALCTIHVICTKWDTCIAHCRWGQGGLKSLEFDQNRINKLGSKGADGLNKVYIKA